MILVLQLIQATEYKTVRYLQHKNDVVNFLDNIKGISSPLFFSKTIPNNERSFVIAQHMFTLAKR